MTVKGGCALSFPFERSTDSPFPRRLVPRASRRSHRVSSRAKKSLLSVAYYFNLIDAKFQWKVSRFPSALFCPLIAQQYLIDALGEVPHFSQRSKRGKRNRRMFHYEIHQSSPKLAGVQRGALNALDSLPVSSRISIRGADRGARSRYPRPLKIPLSRNAGLPGLQDNVLKVSNYPKESTMAAKNVGPSREVISYSRGIDGHENLANTFDFTRWLRV